MITLLEVLDGISYLIHDTCELVSLTIISQQGQSHRRKQNITMINPVGLG